MFESLSEASEVLAVASDSEASQSGAPETASETGGVEGVEAFEFADGLSGVAPEGFDRSKLDDIGDSDARREAPGEVRTSSEAGGIAALSELAFESSVGAG